MGDRIKRREIIFLVAMGPLVSCPRNRKHEALRRETLLAEPNIAGATYLSRHGREGISCPSLEVPRHGRTSNNPHSGILIPDISGFTDFTKTTEIDHAAHILTELLELLVESNETGFTLAEIEGDAVLFYRTGEPLERARLVAQCLTMFSRFHQRLMVIERDTVCQCGACQSASKLTLKFIAHFGYLKEIKVARFVKATGVDMIVAHRLLKKATSTRTNTS